jgi:hypothetical protein
MRSRREDIIRATIPEISELPERQPADATGVRYEERGPAVSEQAKKVRPREMIRELRSLGYFVERPSAPSSSPA